jgi:hypothetical protein
LALSPEESKLFESCLSDIDVFITGFEKQSAREGGERLNEPLERLRMIRANVLSLRNLSNSRSAPDIKGSESSSSPSSPDAALVDTLNRRLEGGMKALLGEVTQIAQGAGALRSSLKRLEGVERQLLSLGQSTMEVASSLRGMIKDAKGTIEKSGPGGASAAALEVPELASRFEVLDNKINAIGRGVTAINSRFGSGSTSINMSEELERAIAGLDIKLQGILERADLAGIIEKLEPRMRNQEDGLKLILAEQKKSLKRLDLIAAKEGPAHLSAEDVANAARIALEVVLETQLSNLKVDLGSQVERLALRLDEVSDQPTLPPIPPPASQSLDAAAFGHQLQEQNRLLVAINDRQGAIESLSLILHPLTNSYQQLTGAMTENKAALEHRLEDLSRQVSALQSIVRNTYRAASKGDLRKPTREFDSESARPLNETDEPSETRVAEHVSVNGTPTESFVPNGHAETRGFGAALAAQISKEMAAAEADMEQSVAEVEELTTPPQPAPTTDQPQDNE